MADFLAQLEEEEHALSTPTSPHQSSSKAAEDANEATSRKIQAVAGNSVAANEIDLRYKHLTAEQTKQLFRAFKRNTNTTRVDLSGNNLEEGWRYIVKLLGKAKYITEMHLKFCDLDDNMVSQLVDVLKQRSKDGVPLKVLSLDGNLISEQLAKEIAGLLPAPLNLKKKLSVHGAPEEKDKMVQELTHQLQTEKKRVDELTRSETRLKEQYSKAQSELEKLVAGQKKKQKDEQKKKGILKINTKNYKILERLYSAGSGAQLYSCLVDGWQCAMKELVVDPSLPDHVILSFETEIAIAERLPYHPNVTRYLFHENTGVKLRLFMTKYNSSLRQVVRHRRLEVEAGRQKPFTPLEVANIMTDIASGLEFLHKNKVMHRDMKPDNILCLLGPEGDPILFAVTDFDSAKLLTKSSQAKTTVGTPAYMAPEVMSSSNSLPYTYKADVWSFGMILYELLTLKIPYEAEDKVQLVAAIQGGKRPSTDHLSNTYSPLLNVFRACTKFEPDARPDLSVIRERLQQIQWSLQHYD